MDRRSSGSDNEITECQFSHRSGLKSGSSVEKPKTQERYEESEISMNDIGVYMPRLSPLVCRRAAPLIQFKALIPLFSALYCPQADPSPVSDSVRPVSLDLYEFGNVVSFAKLHCLPSRGVLHAYNGFKAVPPPKIRLFPSCGDI